MNVFYSERRTSKGLILSLSMILGALLFLASTETKAAYTIALFNNGTFCAATYPTAYQSGSFSITETAIGNRRGFTRSQTNRTLILGFSGTGFQFNPGVGTVTVSGTGCTVVSYVIASTSITVTLSTISTNTSLNTISFNNIQVRSTAAGSVAKIVRTGGTFRIDNRTNRPSSTTSWGDLTSSLPVAYSSSTTTQASTASLFSGSTNNAILRIQVVVTGTCSSTNVTQFNFTTAGTTTPAVDIANAKVFYTGTSNLFATTTQFGSQVNSPNGNFSVTGTTTLSAAGTYYFWLAYDAGATGVAVPGDVLDAQIATVVVGGSARTPSVTNPAGSRTISSNIYYSINAGNWTTTTNVWSRTSGGAACGCAPTAGSGWVFVNHAISLNATETVDIVTIQNGGVLTNTAGSILTTTGSIITTGNGNFTMSSAWVTNNMTLTGTATSKSSITHTISGSLDIASPAQYQMTAASGTTLTVNGNINVDGILTLSGNNLIASNAAGVLLSGIGSITGTGTITLGVSKLIPSGSTLVVSPILSVSGAATITNQGSLTTSNNISGTGSWLNDTNSSLTMGGTTSSLSITGFTASAIDNTVIYSGSGAQPLKGVTYHNVVVGGGGTKTLGAAMTVNGTLTIQGTAQLSVAALDVILNADWINNSSNATPYSSTGTTTFNGDGSITGSGTNSFNNFAISATGDLTSHPTAGKVFVAGSWTNDGDFDNNDSNITFNGTSVIGGGSVTIFNDVIVNTGNSLTFPDDEVDFEGDLTVNGTLTPGLSSAVFAGGGSTQLIKGATTTLTLYQMEVDNPAAFLTLQRPVTVTNALTLTSGFVTTTTTNMLTLNNGVTLTGGDADAFVNGPMTHVFVGGATKTFPIGKGSDYRPVVYTVATSGNPTSNYVAEVFNASAAALGLTLPGTIERVSGKHYWRGSLSNSTGLTSIRATLSYEANDQVTDPTHLVVARSQSGAWINAGGSGSAATSGTILSNTFTTLDYLTLGNTGSNPLPVTLTKFEAHVNSSTVNLHWETASEENNDFFTIEKSKDARNYEPVATVKGAGTTTRANSYDTADLHPFPGLSYYRLKQTDFNGAFVYSDPIPVSFSGTLDFSLYPNPVTGSSLMVTMSGNVHDEVQVIIRDVVGNQLYSEKFVLQNESDVLTLTNIDSLPKGIYIVSASNSNYTNHERIVLE